MPRAKKTEQEQQVRPKNRTVQSFIDALNRLEEKGDHTEIAALFGEACRLSNVQLEQPMEGPQGAQRYWRQYRNTFKAVKSQFTRITEGHDRAVLEWITQGTLETGRSIQYAGVTILQIDGDKVTDFMAYFDTRPFTEHL
jgi:hypothetical protein